MTNCRSSSERWAIDTIAAAGLPSGPCSSASMSSGVPAPHAAKAGEASRPLRRRASVVRSAGGKNVSRSKTPSLRSGGCCTWPTRVGRSRLRPAVHDVSIRLASRMNSREASGSASIPTRPRRPGDEALDLVAHRLDVARVRRRLERADEVHRHARRGAGGVDRRRRPVVLGLQPRAVDATSRPGPPSTASPAGRRSRRGDTPAFWASPSLIHGRKSAGARFGEQQAEVGEIALRVDEQARHAGTEALLDEHDAEAGLARPGHAHDHAVRREVAARQAHPVGGALVGRPGRRSRRGSGQPCRRL